MIENDFVRPPIGAGLRGRISVMSGNRAAGGRRPTAPAAREAARIRSLNWASACSGGRPARAPEPGPAESDSI
jgi:hypothetical protein